MCHFISRISDHLPYFICLNNLSKRKKTDDKFVKCKVNKPEAIKALIDELNRADIYNNLDKSLEKDPNHNYDIMIKTIIALKNKHLPHKFVKFNKRNHKDNKWITYGIIKSINNRDIMYYKLKCTDPNSVEYVNIKQNLSVFNGILKKSIKEAKLIYYHRTFENYKYDIKNTWKTISSLLCKSTKKDSPIKEIRVNDKLCTNLNDICKGFNDFFVNIGPKLAADLDPNQNIPYTLHIQIKSDPITNSGRY